MRSNIYHYKLQGYPLCQNTAPNLKFIEKGMNTRGRKICHKCKKFRKFVRHNGITRLEEDVVLVHLPARARQILTAWSNFLDLTVPEVAKLLIERNIMQIASMLNWPEVTYLE